MAQPTILIIDDERLQRWALREHLAQRGYRVLEASTGAEGLSLSSGQVPPEVILLDLRLPDADGLALLEALHRLAPGSRIMVLSSYATPETSRWALDHGAACVRRKPCDLDVVATLVEDLLHNGCAHPPGC